MALPIRALGRCRCIDAFGVVSAVSNNPSAMSTSSLAKVQNPTSAQSQVVCTPPRGISMICIAWHIMGAGVIAVGWQDMIAKIFPVNRRGRFFGITNFGGTATGVLGATAVSWLLDHYAFPFGYLWSFLIGAICISISWIFLAMTKEPRVVPETEPVSNRDYWKQIPKIVRRNW